MYPTHNLASVLLALADQTRYHQPQVPKSKSLSHPVYLTTSAYAVIAAFSISRIANLSLPSSRFPYLLPTRLGLSFFVQADASTTVGIQSPLTSLLPLLSLHRPPTLRPNPRATLTTLRHSRAHCSNPPDSSNIPLPAVHS